MKKHYNLKALTQGVKAFAAILMVTLVSMSGLLAQTAQYQLVSEDQTDWSGTYLLTAPHNTQGTVALSGFSTTSTVYGTFTALNDLVSEGTIESNATTDAMQLTIASTGNGTYTIATANGEYLGWTSGNSLAHASAVSSDKYEWTLYFDNGNLRISNANTPVRMLQWNASSPRFACYGNTNQTACSLYKLSVVAPVAVAAPLLTPGTGTYYVPQTVSISAQNGATIYYTIDGTTPTENSTVYTEPFVVNATTTVKAIAVDGEDVSNVTTAVYTVTLPIEVANIAAFKAVDNTSNIYKITGDVTVIGQYSNKYHTFIQDNTGALYIYGTMANAYNPGDVISGGVCGTYSLYNGLIEMKPAGPAAAEGTPGTAIDPIVVTLAELISNYADYEGKLVTVIGATAAQDRTFGTSSATKGANITQGDATVQIYNTWGAITNKEIAQGDVLNVTGYVIRYNNTVEIVPRGAEDIIMAVAELPYTLDFDNNVDDGFVIDNATATNKWYVGQASDFDNNKLFISNNGATNKYTNDASTAYASRTLRIPAAGALLSFDYRVMGEGNYDNLTVSIMKDGEATVLATLNNTNEWTNASYVIDPSLAGVVDLVFTWKNDNSGAYQFPAAVDNISVIENPCAQPTNLAAAVSGTTATITWTAGEGQNAWTVEYKPTNRTEWHTVSATTPSVTLADLTGNTNYNVRVKANCGASSSIWANANFAIDCQELIVSTVRDYALIGSEDGASTNSYLPFYGLYNYAYSQQIVDASDINAVSGTIYSISFKCSQVPSSNSTGGIRIWMANTNKSTFSSNTDYIDPSQLTEVYVGPASYIYSSGWNEFVLDTPFEYTGGNLVIAYYEGNGSYSSSYFYVNSTSGNKAIYHYNDTQSNVSYTNPASNTGAKGITSNRNVMKFNMDLVAEVCADVPACAEPTNLTVSNITTNSAEIAWNAGADETVWTVEYRPAASESWTAAQTTETNYVLNGLNANTPYVVRVSADCGTTTSEYVVANFTTEASCLVPTNITKVNNGNNTTIYWIAAGEETAWVVEYKEAASTVWNTVNVANEPMIVLANLTSNALYDVRIKAVCDENNESAWATYQFTSDCQLYAVPFMEDFESYAASTSISTYSTFPECWNVIFSGTSAGYKPHVYSGSSYNPTNTKCLIFTSGSTIYGANAYAVLPPLDADLNNVILSFDYRMESTTSGSLTVGYITDAQDANSYVALKTIQSQTAGTNYETTFENIPAGAKLAFRWSYNTSYYSCAIDNISVTMIPSCLVPTNVAVSNATTTTADLAWTAGNDETSWQIEYGVAGFAHGAGTVVTTNVPAYAFTGLTAGTAYDVYVRAICNANEYSEWAEVTTFRTDACEEADKCVFTLNMEDSYGDGWNGAAIRVSINGIEQGTYTVSGYSNSATIAICESDEFTLSWISGSFDDECSYTLEKDGETRYSGSGSQNGVFVTQTGCSSTPTPPVDACAQDLPYTEDFESYTANTSYSSFSSYPDCWDMIYTGTSQNYRPHVYNSTSYNPTNTKCLIITSGGATYGSNNYVVLPPFNADLNNVQMSFKYRMESTSSGTLYVGYVTDATNGSTFVSLATMTNKTTGTDYEMSLAGHNIPAGARIAFKWSYSSSYWRCCIDNINVEQIPTCPKPSITNVVATQNTATVTIGTISNATDYEVVCGEVGFDPETATPIAFTGNTVTLTGLNHSTDYQVYARAICSETDQSLWSAVYNFQTECGPYALPYFENFEGVTSTTSVSTTVFPKCWNHEFTGTSTSYGPSIYANSSYAHSGMNSLKFYANTGSSTLYGNAIAILPEFSTDLNIMGMTFYARKYSATYGSQFEVGVVTDINNPFASFVPVQTINPSSVEYNFYTVSFADYTGANGHIAFRVNKSISGSSATYHGAYIDDITVEQVVFNKDLELVSAEPIADACDLSDARVTIKVKNNNASGAISSFMASYQINGGSMVTETITPETPIAVDSEYTYTFVTAPVFVDGANNINISVSYAGDANDNNNALTLGPVTLLTPTELPYAEDFSDVVMGQGGWTVGARNDNPVMWSVVNGTPTYTFSDEFNASSYMVSPCLHIPAGQTMISYDYNALDVLPENLVVYVGTSDQPADWTVIGQHNNFTHSNNAYHVDYAFNNAQDGIYYIIVKAASVRGSMGVTFDNLNIAPSYVVTITTGNNGTANPTGTVTVPAGDDLNINILPNAGYHVASITVDGQVVAGEDALNAMVYPFTLEDVAANTDVNVTFTANTVKVYKTVAGQGHFVPATAYDNVAYGAAHTVTAVAEPHYHLNAFTVANYEGGIVANVTNDVVANGTTYTYTFNHIYSDKYVKASFEIDTVGIHYTVEGNGIVDNHVVETSATFDHYVDYGTTFNAMFVPAIGYHVAGVTINGVFYGNIDEWQFANLSGEQYVTVVFEKNVYTITTAGYGQGTVSDGETFEYDPEHTYTFTATPAAGYHIESILRNNVELNVADPEATYTETLTNILSDYNYNVVFNPSQYTVTATAGANGLITPAGVTSYYYNNQALYNVTADLGYYISGITIDGVEVDLDPSLRLTTFTHTFTFTGTMAHNHTINATFARLQYTVTVDAGAHGTITPGTSTYNYGATPTFTIAPAAGYGIVDVTVDGHSVGAVSSYTFTSLTGNHTIAATFAQYEYTIQASAGNGGTITPSGLINAVYGGTQNFTITPSAGYHTAAIYVDGIAAEVASQYSFASIDASHTIHVIFEPNNYTVTVNQPANGNITPGTTEVTYGATPTFVVTPNTGYNVTAITVNGSNVISSAVNTNGVYTYTMAPVTANATVTATMTQKTFTITATAGAHGTINGPTTVNYGANATYTITPAAGYVVDNVTVDGMAAGAVTSYTFTNVVANHTINATFRTEDCDVPTNMHTIDVTTSTATFMWYHPTATAFEVQYKAVDAAAYTTVNVNAMSYDVIDLTPSTSYVWMVRANCGNGNYSEWSNGNIFRTLDVPDIHDGIEDYNVKEMVNVYASHSNVYIVNEGNVQIDNVQIFDIYGKMVYNGKVSSNNEVISMNVATGAYMVRLTTDKGMATYKVVLTK